MPEDPAEATPSAANLKGPSLANLGKAMDGAIALLTDRGGTRGALGDAPPEEAVDLTAPDDLASLPELNDASVLSGIKKRFAQDKIYTRVNNLLIAMNPYQRLPIYGEDAMARYKASSASGSVDPHVYGTAAAAYSGLLELRSQSIVISGESGAGKSESAKKVLHQLAYSASKGGSGKDDEVGIEERILASNPILEAFGNAKTSMNNNSSRYGKFLMLQFDVSGKLVGSHVKTYLLEKTRVVSQGSMERNYHIGYMLCQEASLQPVLKLPPASDLTYTGRTGCLLSPGWDDAEEFASCRASMLQIGLPEEGQERLWRVLASILLMGQLDFGESEALPEAAIAGDSAAVLKTMCELIETDADATTRALTIKMTKMGADWITTPNTPAKSSELRHGFARSMYSTIFDWLVAQINRSLKLGGEEDDEGAAQQFIGILDIFGFETFEINSLEQLCINFCNERLQATFNEAVFAAVQQENAAEGVELPEADLSEIDNTGVVQLIGGKKPAGILHALNEECVVPKGSDNSLLDKLFETHKGNPRLSKPLRVKNGFTVTHFVGPVTYLATGMLLKNKDPVSEDLMVLLQRSKSPFVQSLFASTSQTKSLIEKRKDTRFQGVAAKFGKQLEELLRLIGYSHMHFVRCIKPNRAKVPTTFEDALVNTQLRCSGVFEAVRVIGMGFPDRIPHHTIVEQFARILPLDERPARSAEGELLGLESEAVSEVLTKLGIGEADFALGTSKVFLKAGTLPKLRSLQIQKQHEQAAVLQAHARAFLTRGRVLVLREERKRRLEEEAAAALAAAQEAERQAAEAQRILEEAEEAARLANESQAFAEALEAEAAMAAAQKEIAGANEVASEKKALAHGKVEDIEGERAKVDFAEGSRAHNRWKKAMGGSVERSPSKTAEFTKRSIAEGENLLDEDGRLGELQANMKLLSKRTASRKNMSAILAGEGASAAAGSDSQGAGKVLTPRGITKAALALPVSKLALGALSPRDGGGGIAPLQSSRAPQRKDVKKVTKKQTKDAAWMDMVLEYASYLGMDPEEDGELLWIAEQALRAPVPEGWEEMMDPFGDLYFYNETTSQSTRQHPMDGYYQQLYLKLRLQKAGGFAGPQSMMEGPQGGGGGSRDTARGSMLTNRGGKTRRGTIQSKSGLGEDSVGRGSLLARGDQTRRTASPSKTSSMASLSEESSTFRGTMTSRNTGGSTTRRQSGAWTSRGSAQGKHVINSISEALEMSSPRSAKFMLDKFGLEAESHEDERCLLINPAIWRPPAEGGEVPFIECLMDKEELGLGQHRLSMFVCLNDNNEAYALGALKRKVHQNTIYDISMSEHEDEIDVAYTGKLSCNAKGSEFVMYDDSNDAVGIRQHLARRELGIVLFGQQQQGNNLPIELVIPRVQRDGTTAQFRPAKLTEAMIQQYKTGHTKHLTVLKGLVQLEPGGRVQLKHRGGDQSAVVFEAYRASGERWAVHYRHPLSAFQAFNVAIAILHNSTSGLLDLLPPLDEVPQAPPPKPSLALATYNSLSHAYGAVYCTCVFGSRIFCGMHSGFVQQWQCPIGAAPVMIEWRAHSGTVYDVIVAGRSLVTASRDWLLRVWDLASLSLVATLPGHREEVRCLCSYVNSPNIVYSGSNDKTVRVWDIGVLQGGDPLRGQVLKGHSNWVRALAVSSDGERLCSAAKNVRVWSTKTLKLLHKLEVGHWIFSLAVCRVSFGHAKADTLFAGCAKGRIRSWKLSELGANATVSGVLQAPGLSRKVRAMTVQGTILFTGDNSGGVRAWDLTTLPTKTLLLQGGHTARVRSISADPVSNTIFTAADDRCVKAWVEMPAVS